MANLREIEELTKHYADAKRALEDRVQALKEKQRVLNYQARRGIKNALDILAERQSALRAAIAESGEVFIQPKTRVFHGIKVGFRKGPGKIKLLLGVAKVVELIKKYFADKKDVLIKTTEKPVDAGLKQLTGAELKKIGVEITDTGDEVFIQEVASDLDKFIEGFLKETDREAELENAA